MITDPLITLQDLGNNDRLTLLKHISLQGSDPNPDQAVAEVKSERSDVREVVDCADHSLGLLNGLARLRQSGLLLDTILRAEGVAFQVTS